MSYYCLTDKQKLDEDPSGANRPVLAEGMIPITYNGTNWIKADEYGAYNNWYDYDNQKWANAVMVTSSKRDTYMNADGGTTIPENDILAYYVWIPRYKYKLFNATYASNTQTQVIEVTFENGTSTTGTVTCTYASNGAETCQNKSNGNWYTHPAFTMINSQGNKTELKGIWVAKFETTGSTTTPTVKPGITSLSYITVAEMYNTSKLIRSTDYLTTNGVSSADSHMMKNIEWGAVAYLKQSIYGLGITDIIYNDNSYYTGGGSGTSYKTNTGQSTSGNITGVYDMNKGIWVGKFETTGSTTTPTIKPSLVPITRQNISAMYSSALSFSSVNYITSHSINKTDSHVIKNIEWGAVAYLKQSNYGLGLINIGVNNYYDSVFKTGCGASAGTSQVTTCNVYNTAKGMLASTTGNITGVYDMSGGAEDYVMGNYNKTAGSSGLTVSGVPLEHIDIYSGTSVSASHLGDATGETAGWYDDIYTSLNSSTPWFARGNRANNMAFDTAGIFAYSSRDGGGGQSYTLYGFRTVLSITE
ncbi:unknown [Clostridium sp. CAG:762]|nr:unknown [Clostridium sp. CAG:762]